MDGGGSQGDGSALSRLGAFVELGKLGIVELWLGFFAGASLLGRGVREDGRALATLGLLLLFGIVVIGVTCCLDDITGARDGVDQANHRGPRWGVRKPLIEGRLGDRQAVRIVRVAAGIGALLCAGVIALAWPLPGWVLVLLSGLPLLALNYSWGLKLSYRGAAEIVVLAGGLGTVLLPYAIVARTWTWTLLVSAALVGAWNAQIVMFSNTADAEGDRANGRWTIAARTTPAANKLYITTFFVGSWALSAAALENVRAPFLYALALCPVWAMQAHQLWLGVVEERWLDARRAGFRVLRTGVFAITLVNLLMG
jgi:1,4-dihydroxy-2-naphthoate polyprenyltransferase